MSLNEIDLVANGVTEKEAKENLSMDIIEYAGEFYEDFQYWSNVPNRKKHIPYILKALILEDVEKIGESIACQPGKN